MTFNIATWMNIESTGRWFYASEFEPAQLQDRPYSVLLLRKLAGKMEHKIKMQMMENPKFAQMLAINITGTVYNFFGYKVQMRENINIAIKGATRSGKSTTGNSWGIYISGLTGVPFDPEKNVCANESEYIQRVKDASFNECFLIDEQKEAKFGAGCLPAGTLILGGYGWTHIEDIKEGDCVYTYNIKKDCLEESKAHPQVYNNSYKSNIVVTLNNGLSIETTPNHEWFVDRSGKLQYVSADKLTMNDVAVIKTVSGAHAGSMSSEFARVLGFIVGDGHISKRHYPSKPVTNPKYRVQFTNAESSVRIQFKNDVESFYKRKLYWIENKFGHVVDGYKGHTHEFYFHDKFICEDIIGAGIPRGNKSSIVRIPPVVMISDGIVKSEFIKALFTCDGTVSRKGWKNQNYHVAFSTVSKRLAEDVMILLMEMGFTPYMNSYHAGAMKDGYKRKRRYWVSIFRRDDLFKFAKEIGFIGRKQKKLLECCSDLRKRLKNGYSWETKNPYKIKDIRKVRACSRVYDIETDYNHNYICKNVVLHNSFREEMSIMDVQNIIAKKCIHTIWVYPSDFISRNSDYGFETYGRDIIHKLARLIVYDVRKSMFGIQQPVGICLVPKFQDPVYQKIPKELWSPYRLKNAELKRPDFDSLHEERYEIKKDSWIDREQHGQMGYHHEMRYKEGVKLGELPVFQTAPNKKRQRIIARQMFRNLTEAEIDEVVEIARMGISFDDLQAALSGKIIKKQDDGEDMGDDVAEEDDEGNGEEFSVDAQKSECVHSSVEPVAKCKEIQDDEEDRVEMIGEESEEEDSGREGVVMKEHAVDSEDLIRLKQDLGAYNPGSRKLRVRVVADEPENASGHADNLPETKG